jgi:choline dehydrogenase
MVDYVVVGAGSSGSVLANRLVNKGFRVTLLEAGGADSKTEVRIPAAFTKLFKTDCDWNYTTTPQRALRHRALYWPRGKMLGGCSSMNAQMWFPGFAADYDGWAEGGARGWTWDAVRPYLSRAVDGAKSGKGAASGLSIEPLRDPNPLTALFLKACEEDGMPRLGALASEGFTQTPTTQRRGSRFSAADGYLKPLARNPKLEVITHALATRVLFEGRRAVGVEYTDSQGRAHRVRVARDVVLASGAVNSPQLLMLSGIGDPEELRRHGIDVRHALPGVGKNLQDHVLTAVIAECSRPVTLVAAETLSNLFRYLFRRRGMLTSNVGEAAAFIRTKPELAHPDIELIFAPVPFQDHGLVKPAGHGITIGAVLLQPRSRGTITLASRDPKVPPIIDPAYFTDPEGEDLRTMCRGVEAARRIMASPALRDYVGKPIEPPSFDGTSEDLQRFIAEQAETLYHPIGTCRMGEGATAVVDPELRVHGLSNLRVVDASVMPNLIRGHTHGPAVIIAERAADLIATSRAN